MDSSCGTGEQEVLGGHRQAAAGLVDGHTVGGPTKGCTVRGPPQRTDDPDIAVVRIMQPKFQSQPHPVAHRQRHLEPVRRGDHDVDAVGQPRVDELGHLGRQRVPGVEGVGVVPAERVEVVDEQEDLAVAILIAGAVLVVPCRRAELLALPQQLLELPEGAADAFGFQGRGHATDVRQLLEGAQLSATVVEAVEGDIAGSVQRRGGQHEGLQRCRLARLRPAVDDHVGRG